MGLLRDKALSHKRVPGTTCGVTTILATMSSNDATDLRDLLADPTIPGSAISRALKDVGLTLASFTINRHRAKECQCH